MNRQIQRLLKDPMLRHFEALTIGYLIALNGFEEPVEMLDSEDYVRGHLMGKKALEAGKLPRPFLGFVPDEDLPFKRGQEVTIPRGIPIHSGGKVRISARARKIRIHHLLNGSNLHIRKDHFREDITPITAPRIVWPGSGSYWTEADINDIPEAVEAYNGSKDRL